MATNKPVTNTDADAASDADPLARGIRALVERTHSPRVIGPREGLGLFRLDYDEALFQRNYAEPVLVARTGRVGEKFPLARAAGRLDVLGVDVVAACVNELIAAGAEPLFFLPSLCAGELAPAEVADVIKGIAEGCSRAGCSLLEGGGIGGSMAGGSDDGGFALSGFAVGVVERRRLLDGAHARAGDVVIGLASEGLHGQGLSLARRTLPRDAGVSPALDMPAPSGNIDEKSAHNAGETPASRDIVDELLRPTRIYVQSVLDVLGAYRVKRVVKAITNIAAGGLAGPWPRVLPAGLAVRLRRGSWDVPPIFQLIADRGQADAIEMVNTFTMGIGLVIIVAPHFAKPVMARLRRHGERCGIIGKLVKGDGGIEWT